MSAPAPLSRSTHCSHHHDRTHVGQAGPGERGAVLLLVAICLPVLVLATAFTVDLGRISTVRRDLQSVADATAMDLSRQLDGRTTSEIVADPLWSDGFHQSLQRNRFDLGDGHSAVASLGHWDPASAIFTPTTGPEVPDSVQVVAEERIDFEFAPGGTTTSRTGVAARTPSAGFCLGSFAARLDSSQSVLLNALLGNTLGVTGVGYAGLAGGQVGIDALATELGYSVGSPSELMAADARLIDVVRAQAEVLRAGGSGDLARATVLDAIAAALPQPDTIVRLGDLFAIDAGGEAAAAAAHLDALELLTTTAFVANGSHFIDVPGVALSLPGGIATTAVRVQVIEAPRCTFGPPGSTPARTAQVRIEATVQAQLPNVSTSTISLVVEGAGGSGVSTDVTCGDPKTLGLDATTALVSSRADVTARLFALFQPIADVALHATSGMAPTVHPVAFTVPPDELGVARQVPTPGLNLGGAGVVTDRVTVLGLPLGVVVNPLISSLASGVVSPLLTQLDDVLVTPLSSILGLTVAGMDATPTAIACTGPAMVG